MNPETFTLQPKGSLRLPFLIIALSFPTLLGIVLWLSDMWRNPSIVVTIVIVYLLFVTVVSLFQKRQAATRLHVQGRRIVLETSKGQEVLDIVADGVCLKAHRVSPRGHRSFIRYELHYLGNSGEYQSLVLDDFSHEDMEKLEFYLAQCSEGYKEKRSDET